MSGYTKLFNSIIASTIWSEPDTVRIVWITLLAMVDRTGVVETSIPGLSVLARVSQEDCEKAIAVLEAPDKYSRNQQWEGRRIKKTEGGWVILNYAMYRAKLSADERREYFRIKKREQRKVSNNVQNVKDKSHLSHIAEAEAEASNTTTNTTTVARSARTKSKMPDNFSLTARMTEFALDKGLVPESELEKFKDYHRPRENRFSDWEAVWRTWCRNAVAIRERSKSGESLSKHEQRQRRTLESYRRSVERDRQEVGSEVRPELPSRGH